jgi:hypothetical protein
MKAIVIDEKTTHRILMGNFQVNVDDLAQTQSDEETRSVVNGRYLYLLSRKWEPVDVGLVIALSSNEAFGDLQEPNHGESFSRILRVAKNAFDRTSTLPVHWRPYHAGRFISIQSNRRNTGENGRISIDTNAQDTGWVFAFEIDRTGTSKLSQRKPEYETFEHAYAHVQEAAQTPELHEEHQANGSVTLSETVRARAFEAAPFEEWIRTRLTTEQQAFVNQPLTSSIRLLGPAGSGKTVALVIKCLKELSERNGAVRYLFLTHALSTVEQIERLFDGMDHAGITKRAPPPVRITTLYALANSEMHYDLYGLTPVSVDGHEGREVQADVIEMALQDFRSSDWITYREACSEPFRRYVESQPKSIEQRFFVWEVMNEFASVLDADGVRSSSERQAKYLEEKRKTTQMTLVNRAEREVILNLYGRFREFLASIKAIGVDQMTADFLNFLDSYRWEALRAQEGYDAVFVDELHLFSRLEKMTFRHLLRDPNTAPVVLMAYDAKQSPRDTFLGMSEDRYEHYNFWRDAKLGKVEKFEFLDVFRYSPQITKALACIDKSFPGDDFREEWPAYKGIAKAKDGPVPTLTVLKTTVDSYRFAFTRAKELQRRLERQGRVAVLCASTELFSKYLTAGDLKSLFVAITSRDDIAQINLSPKKFVFSSPEYVAGLQFHTVLLIEVNKNETPQGPYSASSTRKFASQVYLGASRAERQLELYATEEHGGPSPILRIALDEGSILRKEASELGY